MHRVLALAASALLVAACGGGSGKRVPRLVGERLDVAENRLDDLGLRYDAIGGGAFGIVVRSHWRVCAQRPRAGARAREVKLVVAHACATGVPDLVGKNLDDAEEQLDEVGIGYTVVPEGDDEVIVEHLWTVCDQSSGADGVVELDVAHICGGDD